MSESMKGWLEAADVAARTGKSESTVVAEILKGIYRSPVCKNGKWLIRTSEVDRVHSCSPVASPPRRCPAWARGDEWYDLAISPVRSHHGVTHLSFYEAARRLGTTYTNIYKMARHGRLKTARHIRHHWYVTAAEVEWLATHGLRRPRSHRNARG